MRKLTAKEILEIVENNYSVESFGYNDLNELSDESKLEVPENLGEEEQNKKQELWNQIVEENIHRLPKEEKESHPKYIKYESLRYAYKIKTEYILQQLGLGEVIEAEQYGGEDQGSTWYSIKHFVDHDVYIRTRGYYSSYHGTDFDYGYGEEVKPVQKVITVFE